MANSIDAKDKYTNGHSSRVAKYSKIIAEKVGMSEEMQDSIFYIALLHDVGKIGIPDTIINKPDKLSDQEYEVVKKHPVIGYDILKEIEELPGIAIGARSHHERYDGKGYPDGLKGEEIPEIARIIAVADAYDAMTSNRSYRKLLEQKVVREEIVKGKGTQFDPKFAEVMLEIIDDDKEYQYHE
ncbi:MAG: HD-GYP domain-containing protein [Lachnospiraceae bacterium]|nr:HD-GYP domain-containing protein [Lachnospiraceae bacterium]